MAFTADEVDAAIQSYLSSEVTVSRTKTGSRDTTAIKKQVYDLLATGLMLRPASIYYIIWLSSNRLRAQAVEQLARLQAIATAAPNVSRTSRRVESTTELTNAEAALIELSSAFNSRTTGVAGAVGPAVQRFRTSVTNFANDELTKNVVVQGDVIETAEELQELIKESWLEGSVVDEQIKTRIDALQDALSDYQAVRLPEVTFQSIVLRCQAKIAELQASMGATTAPRDSRSALLDILAMRTLIQRASSFRSPSRVLAPLVTDPSSGFFVDGPGVEASYLGLAAAPFKYAAGDALNIQVNQGAEAITTVLPGSSAAVMRSKVMSPWVNPPSTNAAAFTVNGLVTNTVAMSLGWTSGPIAAAALDAAYADIVVTWDSSTNQLVFTTVATTDTCSLLVTGHSDFIGWAFSAGAPLLTRGTPVSAEIVAQAIQQSSAAVSVSVERIDYFQMRGSLLGNVLTLKTHEASDLNADGTTTVVVGANLEQLGVVPGYKIKITSPAITATVVSVDGGTLVLDTAVPAATGATYFVAPDFSNIVLGSRVSIVSSTIPSNSHYSFVISVGIGFVNLGVTFTTDADVRAVCFLEQLRITVRGTTVNSDLSSPLTPGSLAIGFAGSTAVVSLSKFSVPGIDFGVRGVAAGDTVDLVSPTAVTYRRSITEVGTTYLVLDVAVPYEAGSWEFTVQSSAALAYAELLEVLETFEAAVPSAATLDATARRLVAGARYSAELEGALTVYTEALEDLIAGLDVYAVPREATVDQSARLLREHGMDRALDLLFDLSISEFFSMKDDEVSYKTWLIRTAADVTREVVPVTKDPRDVTSQWRTLSTQPTTFDPRAATDKETNG